jgi:hypothetical protein
VIREGPARTGLRAAECCANDYAIRALRHRQASALPFHRNERHTTRFIQQDHEIYFSLTQKDSSFSYLSCENPYMVPNGREIISRPFSILKARKMQEKYKYGLWGAAAGAIALALVGFTWGGWVTGSTAKMQADAAGWTALLPVCADAILANPAALAELKTKRTTDYDDVVRDHLKMIAGRADMSFAFRRDCGKTIEARMQSAAVKN